MARFIKTAALALALPAALAGALPAAAHDRDWDEGDRWEQNDRGDHRGWDRGRYDSRYDRRYGGYGDNGGYYGEPVYRSTRTWRGEDGRYYCRRSNGTTGLVIGGAAGALLGREVAGYRGDRTLGAILGGAAGALLGREVDRGGSRCR